MKTVKNNDAVGKVLKDTIELVKTHWDETGQALLLSHLGLELKRRGHDTVEVLAGRKLASFLSVEAKGQLRVIRPAGNPLIVGVVPSDVDVSDGTQSVFPDGSIEARVRASMQLYAPAFWAAFTHKLSTGRVRVLSLEPKIQFQDVERDKVPTGGLIVPADSIVNVDSVKPTEFGQVVDAKIKHWLAQSNVREQQVLANSSGVVNRGERISVLEKILRSLSEEQLQRVSLPLDVVSKLSQIS
jgi:hypothetical protein